MQRKILLALIVVIGLSFSAYAGPMDIPADARCEECGMKVDPSSGFAAQMITADGKLLPFCDVGDMLYYYRTKLTGDAGEVYVQEESTGRWIDARTAHFVKDKKYVSPMGWGIAAFSEEQTGAVSFEDALRLTE